MENSDFSIVENNGQVSDIGTMGDSFYEGARDFNSNGRNLTDFVGEALVDRNAGTTFMAPSGKMEVTYSFVEGLQKVKLENFSLRIGKDCPKRDATSWLLEGNKSDDGEDWEEIFSFDGTYPPDDCNKLFKYELNKIESYSGLRFSGCAKRRAK
jgi:hypothetical protein